MTETWKPIPGYPGYEVSDHGRVRSYWKRHSTDAFIVKKPQCFLSLNSCTKGGYPLVVLSRNGLGHSCYIHRIVMRAFVGPCPDGLQVCHNDGDPANNHLSNLRYDTQKSNVADAWEHGTQWYGCTGKLSEDQVIKMRQMAANGAKRKDLARKFGIDVKTVSRVCLGITYRNVGGPIVDHMYDRARVLVDSRTEYQTQEASE